MSMRQEANSRQAGIVLVTSLFVLVALVGLSVGAFFLTNMNLRIAENTRAATIAQYNAHEGLDVALLILGREFFLRGDGTWGIRLCRPDEAGADGTGGCSTPAKGCAHMLS